MDIGVNQLMVAVGVGLLTADNTEYSDYDLGRIHFSIPFHLNVTKRDIVPFSLVSIISAIMMTNCILLSSITAFDSFEVS